MSLTKKARQSGAIRQHETKTGKTYWLVDLGRKNGKRLRSYFKTKKEAETFLEQKAIELANQGTQALSIAPGLRMEALECDRRLRKVGASLSVATDFYLQNSGASHADQSLEDSIAEFLKSKIEIENADSEYVKKLKIACGVFSRHFPGRSVKTILKQECQDWLTEMDWKPLNRRNYIRDLSIFFSWAEENERIPTNPFRKIPRPRLKTVPPPIFTVKEAAKLLKASLENPDLELLPFVCLGLFSGIRVCEFKRMDWKDVVPADHFIHIRAEVAKGRSFPRTLDISKNLHAWLKICRNDSGAILPANFRLKRDRLYGLAGIKTEDGEWAENDEKRNPFRHSFGSYHLVEHDDPGKTQLQMGQQTASVLFKHYRQVVTRKAARAFWQLSPTKKS
ncbi:MAG: site-specific integrase [Verrucomicrobiota bacterium]